MRLSAIAGFLVLTGKYYFINITCLTSVIACISFACIVLNLYIKYICFVNFVNINVCLCKLFCVIQVKMKSMFAIGFAFTALLSMFNSMLVVLQLRFRVINR